MVEREVKIAEIKQAEVPLENKNVIDGDEITILCSHCEAPLVQIKITDPHEETLWKFEANCPHCGDHSWTQEIQGKFLIGPTDYTDLTNFQTEEDVYRVETTKGRKEYNV